MIGPLTFNRFGNDFEIRSKYYRSRLSRFYLNLKFVFWSLLLTLLPETTSYLLKCDLDLERVITVKTISIYSIDTEVMHFQT